MQFKVAVEGLQPSTSLRFHASQYSPFYFLSRLKSGSQIALSIRKTLQFSPPLVTLNVSNEITFDIIAVLQRN
jgi:hypothetical protein